MYMPALASDSRQGRMRPTFLRGAEMIPRAVIAAGLAALALLPVVAHAQGGVPVTRDNYTRAESDRTFFNISQLAGGVNRFYHYRTVTPIDNQSVVRMNKDTLYSGAVVDTSKGATLVVPQVPAGRYFSVLLIDNDHYSPAVIYTPGTHKLPQDTKYLFLAVRIQLLRPDDPADIALVNRLQDQFVITATSADPFAKPEWDQKALAALTDQYNREFAKFAQYPDGSMAPRGQADESLRHLAAAGAWGLFPTRDAVYINYNGGQGPQRCYCATYPVPENKAFWSITVYGEDGYMKSPNSILNGLNAKMNADGTVTARFGSQAMCGDVPNRLDTSAGWNFLMRVYRPGESVVNRSYKLPDVAACTAGT
jgi:hypothetical protein